MNTKSSPVEVPGITTITVAENKQKFVEQGNFEDAIKATGFGKFNLSLLCVVMFGAFAQIVEQISLPYVIPIAQCDLNLSLEQKGVAVSISYTGMILSAFIWGYICDTYGRRRIISFGFIGCAICYILSALSQNYAMLLTLKFFSGFIFTGPLAAFLSYLTEFHSIENRSRIQLLRGLSCGMGSIILPMVAWIILPRVYEISVFGLTLHAWNFFLAVCSLPALTTGIIFIFMPESPRYLMASGKSSEALEIFKKVYNRNTGRRFSTFPVKKLTEERAEKSLSDSTKQNELSAKDKFLSGFSSVKSLFKPPYLLRMIHTSLAGITVAFGAFTMRMWYPQFLQTANDFKENSTADLCKVLDSLTHENTSVNAICTVNLDNSSVYINASILGAVQLLAFLLAGILVNKTGKKILAVTLSCCAASCPILIYFISNDNVMIALFPLLIAFSEVSANMLLTITMEVFPTKFRSTATNLNMMSVRMGIFSGNVALPYLFKAGCLPTVLFISIAILGTSALVSMLPNTDNKDLE